MRGYGRKDPHLTAQWIPPQDVMLDTLIIQPGALTLSADEQLTSSSNGEGNITFDAKEQQGSACISNLVVD
ncbi:hypothetical protein ACLOJK_034856, partial [Asimina triloba]